MSLLTFARRTDGRIVHVDSVENGLSCDCCCPKCARPLIAKNGGEIREHHFSHEADRKCSKSVETALHLACKQLLKEEKSICVYRPFTLPAEKLRIDFERVETEYVWDGGKIKPDVVGFSAGEPCLIIEIAVTHSVDKAKEEKLRKVGIPAIEITVDPDADHNWEHLRRTLIEGVAGKRYLALEQHDEFVSLSARLEGKVKELEELRLNTLKLFAENMQLRAQLGKIAVGLAATQNQQQNRSGDFVGGGEPGDKPGTIIFWVDKAKFLRCPVENGRVWFQAGHPKGDRARYYIKHSEYRRQRYLNERGTDVQFQR